jgi:hypothetical protein
MSTAAVNRRQANRTAATPRKPRRARPSPAGALRSAGGSGGGGRVAIRASAAVLEALRRGRAARETLLAAEGGMISARTFGELVGLSHTAVHLRRRRHALVAVALENGDYLFPVWQIDAGRVLPGVPAVVAELQEAGADGIAMAGFFLGRSESLDGRRPLDALRAGEVEEVRAAASAWSRHGGR